MHEAGLTLTFGELIRTIVQRPQSQKNHSNILKMVLAYAKTYPFNNYGLILIFLT
jgi:hypothetical protein